MKPVRHPDKQQVRDWLEQRQKEPGPPPAPEVVRRELGWDLTVDEDKQEVDDAR